MGSSYYLCRYSINGGSLAALVASKKNEQSGKTEVNELIVKSDYEEQKKQ